MYGHLLSLNYKHMCMHAVYMTETYHSARTIIYVQERHCIRKHDNLRLLCFNILKYTLLHVVLARLIESF